MADTKGFVWVDSSWADLIGTLGPRVITTSELQEFLGMEISFDCWGSATEPLLEITSQGLWVKGSGGTVAVSIIVDRNSTRFQKIHTVKIKLQKDTTSPIEIGTITGEDTAYTTSKKQFLILEINKEIIGGACYQWPDTTNTPVFSHINSTPVKDNLVPTTERTTLYGGIQTVPVGNFGINGKEGEWLAFPKGSYASINRNSAQNLRFIFPNNTYGDVNNVVLPIYKNWRTGYWPRLHVYDSNFDAFYEDSLITDVLKESDQTEEQTPTIQWLSEETVKLGSKTVVVPKGSKIWCFRRSASGDPYITQALTVGWGGTKWTIVDNPLNISKSSLETDQNPVWLWVGAGDGQLHIKGTNAAEVKVKLPIKMEWWYSDYEYSSRYWTQVTDSSPDFHMSHAIRKWIIKADKGYSWYADSCGGDEGNQTITKYITDGADSDLKNVYIGSASDTGDTEFELNLLDKPIKLSYYYDGYTLIPGNGRDSGIVPYDCEVNYGCTANEFWAGRQIAAYVLFKAFSGYGVLYPKDYYMSILTTGNQSASKTSVASRTLPFNPVPEGRGSKITRKWALFGAQNKDGTGNHAAVDMELNLKGEAKFKYAYAIIIEYPEPIWEVQQAIRYSTHRWVSNGSSSYTSWFIDEEITAPSLWTIKSISSLSTLAPAPVTTSAGTSGNTNGKGTFSFTCRKSSNNFYYGLAEYCTWAYYTTAEAQSSPIYRLYANSSGKVCCDITNRASTARTFYLYDDTNANKASVTVPSGGTYTLDWSGGSNTVAQSNKSYIRYSSNNINYDTPLPWIQRKYGVTNLLEVERGEVEDANVYYLRFTNHSNTARSVTLYYGTTYVGAYTVPANGVKVISKTFTTKTQASAYLLGLSATYWLQENCQYYSHLYHTIPKTLSIQQINETGSFAFTHSVCSGYTADWTYQTDITQAVDDILFATVLSYSGWSSKPSILNIKSTIVNNKYKVTLTLQWGGGGGPNTSFGNIQISCLRSPVN